MAIPQLSILGAHIVEMWIARHLPPQFSFPFQRLELVLALKHEEIVGRNMPCVAPALD